MVSMATQGLCWYLPSIGVSGALHTGQVVLWSKHLKFHNNLYTERNIDHGLYVSPGALVYLLRHGSHSVCPHGVAVGL